MTLETLREKLGEMQNLIMPENNKYLFRALQIAATRYSDVEADPEGVYSNMAAENALENLAKMYELYLPNRIVYTEGRKVLMEMEDRLFLDFPMHYLFTQEY